MPHALSYGCPYDLFWKLNPRKLEPFRDKRKIEIKAKFEELDFLAWKIGAYNIDSMGMWWGKNPKYPDSPDSMQDKQPESDGAKFARFAAKHNQALRQQRKQKTQE